MTCGVVYALQLTIVNAHHVAMDEHNTILIHRHD